MIAEMRGGRGGRIDSKLKLKEFLRERDPKNSKNKEIQEVLAQMKSSRKKNKKVKELKLSKKYFKKLLA